MVIQPKRKYSKKLCIRLSVVLLALAIFFLPQAWADSPADSNSSAQQDSPENTLQDGDTSFIAQISVNGSPVDCTFLPVKDLYNPTAHNVQIGMGEKGASAIDPELEGSIDTLPETVKNASGVVYNVTAIGPFAFYGSKVSATGLAKNQSIKLVGSYSFGRCLNLETTDLDKSRVETLDVGAFKESSITTTGLESNEHLATLNESCFDECKNLKTTGLAHNKVVKVLGNYAFNQTNILDTGLIDNEITKVGSYCFFRCSHITETGIGSPGTKISAIGKYCFAFCSGITDTGLGGNNLITEISDNAFSDCENLSSTGLKNNYSVRYIGSNAFYHDNQLTSTETAGRNLTTTDDDGTVRAVPIEFGVNCFANCFNMEDTGLAGTHAILDKTCFKYCGHLITTGITADSNIPSIGQGAFQGDMFLENACLGDNDTITELGSEAFAQCGNLLITGLATNTSITKIPEKAFANCEALRDTGLSTNTHVTEIGEFAFLKCYYLENTGLAGNSTITEMGKCAFQACGKTRLSVGLKTTGLATNTGLTQLPASAFAQCVCLLDTGLDANENIRYIGVNAFDACAKLGTENYGTAYKGSLALHGGIDPDSPNGSKSLTVESGAFDKAHYDNLYLFSDSKNTKFNDRSFPNSFQSLYVSSTWALVRSFKIADKTYFKDTGNLVCMFGMRSASFSRKKGVSNSGRLSISLGDSHDLDIAYADGTRIGRYHCSRSSDIDLPGSSGETTLRNTKDKLVISLSPNADGSPGYYTYPTGDIQRGYNEIIGELGQCDLPAVNYTVKFHGNGSDASQTMDDLRVDYGSGATLTPNAFSRAGESLVFAGWNTEEDGSGKAFDDQQLFDNFTDIEGSVVNLYAQWVSQLTFALSLSMTDPDGQALSLPGVEYSIGPDKDNPDKTSTLYADSDMKELVNWPLISGDNPTITVYGAHAATYYVFIRKNPLTYKPPGIHSVEISNEGSVKIDGQRVDPEHGVITIPEVFTSTDLPQTGGLGGFLSSQFGGGVCALALVTSALMVVRRRRIAHVKK